MTCQRSTGALRTRPMVRVLMSVGNPRVPDPLGVQHQVVLVMRDEDPTGGGGLR